MPDRWVGDNQSTILPEGYTKLLYIQGSGASYIDTQIVPTTADISVTLDNENNIFTFEVSDKARCRINCE